MTVLTTAPSAVERWVPVCSMHDVPIDRGVAVMVDSRQIALFRLRGDRTVYAIDNVDPFTGVACLSRGLVGDVHGEAMVVSPLHKQRFRLKSGVCIDDSAMAVRTFGVRVVRDVVEVDLP